MLPVPRHKKDIIEKLRYAEAQRNELSDALMRSYEPDGSLPKFISNRAEHILAETRECFDHLGKEIVEAFVLPFAGSKLRTDYENGKIKQYFPFYPGQLKNSDVFKSLKKNKSEIFDEFKNLVDAMDDDLFLTNTSFRVRLFREIATMVNEKKHASVLEVKQPAIDKTFVGTKDGNFVFDKGFKNDHPNFRVMLPSQDTVRHVASFRFSYNNLDVDDLCLFATRATSLTMDHFYKFFEGSEDKVAIIDPPPTITSGPLPANYDWDAQVFRSPDQ